MRAYRTMSWAAQVAKEVPCAAWRQVSATALNNPADMYIRMDVASFPFCVCIYKGFENNFEFLLPKTLNKELKLSFLLGVQVP